MPIGISSYPRRHNYGQPRPPLAQNWPGHHTSSSQLLQTVDPLYLKYLHSQAAYLGSQISALYDTMRVTPSPTVHQVLPHNLPTAAFHHPSHSRLLTTHNPACEGSISGTTMPSKMDLKATMCIHCGIQPTHIIGTLLVHNISIQEASVKILMIVIRHGIFL